MFKAQETIRTLYSRVSDYRSYCLLKTRQMIYQLEAICFHDTTEWAMGICPTLSNITGEILNALPSFLADLNNMFDKCGVCEREAVWVILELQDRLVA